MTRRILIVGGQVIDGRGGPMRRADVLVDGDLIAAVEPNMGETADGGVDLLDAAGCIVAPGFVDIHSHSDYTLLVDPTGESAIRQGVTTEIVGNCGFGCFPVRNRLIARNAVYGYIEGIDHFFSDAGRYYDALDAVRPAVNVATLVPNGQLRMSVAGIKATPLSPDELSDAKALLAGSLEAGAWGFSTGLEYPAERGADEEELCALCRVTAQHGGIYATHTRYRDSGSTAAVEEAIRTARRAGVALQISHLLPRNFHDEGHSCLACAERAIAAGDPLDFDMHTRLFGTTNLAAALPPRLLQMEPGEIAATLATSAGEREARAYRSMFTEADWRQVILYDSKAFPQFARQSIAAIANSLGTDGFGAMLFLVRHAPEAIRSHYVLRPMYDEADLFTAFGHPKCMPGSDATTLSTKGPLAGRFFHGAYSWAAWYISRAALGSGLLSIEEAIHRITARPCAKLGIPRRGAVVPGHFADLVVFDPERFRDRTSMYEPNHTATGVRHLLVNGEITLRNETITMKRGGRALRRSSALLV